MQTAQMNNKFGESLLPRLWQVSSHYQYQLPKRQSVGNVGNTSDPTAMPSNTIPRAPADPGAPRV